MLYLKEKDLVKIDGGGIAASIFSGIGLVLVFAVSVVYSFFQAKKEANKWDYMKKNLF